MLKTKFYIIGNIEKKQKYYYSSLIFSNKQVLNPVKVVKIDKLSVLYKLFIVSKYSYRFFFDMPVSNKSTRQSIKIKKENLLFKYWFFKVLCLWFKLKKTKTSGILCRLDFINRLWNKQWTKEWWKIRYLWKKVSKKRYKKRFNLNYRLLRCKLVVRNFFLNTKKKQRFKLHFNLGFMFYEYQRFKKTIKRFNRRVERKPLERLFILKKKNV